MSSKINVRITARQEVQYDQIREMAREDWDKLKKTPEKELEDRDGPLANWLDLSDVAESREFDFDMFVCDVNGKPTQPRDEYVG